MDGGVGAAGGAAGREEVLLEIQRSRNNRLRIARSVFKGKTYVDVRQYYLADDDSWKPSPKGISLRVEELADLARVLREVALRSPVAEDNGGT